jgi:hypothetical protein
MTVTLKNKQIVPVHNSLVGWWNNTQLPITFQRQLIAARQRLAAEGETTETLRERLLEKYAAVDSAGKRIMLDAVTVKLTDPQAYADELEQLMDGEFDCPGISLEDFEALFEKLQVTPAQYEALLGKDGCSILVSSKAPAPPAE